MVLFLVLSQFRIRITLPSAPISLASRKNRLTPLEPNHCAKRNAKSHRIKSLRKNHRGVGTLSQFSEQVGRDLKEGSGKERTRAWQRMQLPEESRYAKPRWSSWYLPLEMIWSVSIQTSHLRVRTSTWVPDFQS